MSSELGDGGDDLVEGGVGVGAHLVVGAVLDRVRREHPGHRREAERRRLGDRRPRRTRSEATNIAGTPRSSRSLMSCTLHDVQLPQSASASITTSHCGGDLVAQVDRRRLGERRLAVALAPSAPCSARRALELVEEHVAARLGDVEQPDGQPGDRRRPGEALRVSPTVRSLGRVEDRSASCSVSIAPLW